MGVFQAIELIRQENEALKAALEQERTARESADAHIAALAVELESMEAELRQARGTSGKEVAHG